MDNQTPPAQEPQTPTPEVAVPVVDHPEQPTKPYGRNWKKWILIYIAIGAVIYAGIYYFILSKQTPKPSSTPVAKAKLSTSPTAISDPTASWKTSIIKPLGLEYKLPPQLNSLGEQKEQTSQGAEGGSRLDVTFGNSNILAFGARSKDFQEGREYSFLDSWGYEAKNGKFNGIKYISSEEYSEEIPSNLAVEITNPNGVKILKITGKNSSPRDIPLAFNPGDGKIGALVNIPNAEYWRGFAVEMSLEKDLTEKDFDQILQTFKFTSQSQNNASHDTKTYSGEGFSFEYSSSLTTQSLAMTKLHGFTP